MKHLIKHIVIVGGRAAGPAAAAKARRENPGAKITMIEAGRYISTGTCEIPYLISGEVSSPGDLVFFTADDFKRHYDVDVLTDTSVTGIAPRQRLLQIESNGTKYEMGYDRLVLTTGAKSKIHPQFPPELKNVHYVKNIEDAEVLLGSEHLTGKSWLVVGASYAGLEFAESLAKKGKDVILIDKDELPGSGFDAEIRQLINEVLVKNGIEFVGKTPELKVFTDSGKVRKIKFDGRLKEIDGVIGSIGIEPETSLAKKAGLELGAKGGIKVDNRMRTSDQYIFAAGDCVELKDTVTGRHVYLPQAVVARDGGYVAGANAAGGNDFMYPVLRNTALRVFDRFATKTGKCAKTLDELRIPYKIVTATADALVHVMPGTHKVFGKLIIGNDGKILGAGFFGGPEVSGYCDIIALAIKAGLKATDLRHGHYNYTPTLSPFKNLIESLAIKAAGKSR